MDINGKGLRVLAFYLLLLFPLSGFGATTYVEGLDHWPVMSLKEAVRLGLEKNFDLQAQRTELPKADSDVEAQKARFDFTLDAAAQASGERIAGGDALTGTGARTQVARVGLARQFKTGLSSQLSLQSSRAVGNTLSMLRDPEYRTGLELDLRQPLLRNRGADVNTTDLLQAQLTRKQADLLFSAQAQRLAQAVELAYLDLAQAIHVYQFRIESRDLANRLLEANRQKLEIGVIPVSEMQEAETAVAARDELVLLARQQVESAGNRIKGLLGIMQDYPLEKHFYRTENLPLPGQEFPSLEQALELALRTRPDLEAARLEVASRQLRIAYQQNSRLPQLDLVATLGVNGLSGEGKNGFSSDDRRDYPDSLQRMSEADGYQWMTGLEFSLPLGNRAAEAGYRRSVQERRQAVYNLKSAENTVETEIIDALVQVRRSLERFQVGGRFEKLAETTLEQEMERLHVGLSDTFRILDFQDKVIAARISKVTALADYNRGVANLYLAMGRNLERFDMTAMHVEEDHASENN